jgi:hypothetical protein
MVVAAVVVVAAAQATMDEHHRFGPHQVPLQLWTASTVTQAATTAEPHPPFAPLRQQDSTLRIPQTHH